MLAIIEIDGFSTWSMWHKYKTGNLSFPSFFFFFLLLAALLGLWEPSSWPWIKATPPAVEAWSLNHWTTGPGMSLALFSICEVFLFFIPHIESYCFTPLMCIRDVRMKNQQIKKSFYSSMVDWQCSISYSYPAKWFSPYICSFSDSFLLFFSFSKSLSRVRLFATPGL